MELKDIGTIELKDLNLYPIIYFDIFKKCIENGYYYKLPAAYGRSKLNRTAHTNNAIHEKRIEDKNQIIEDGEKTLLNTFLELSKEEIEEFGFSGKTLFKLLWLQKYLRGEVSGCYSVTEDISFQSFQELVELEKKDKIIQGLKKQLEEERAKNKELRNKINELESEVKKVDKSKSKLLNFITENKKLLDDYYSELN